MGPHVPPLQRAAAAGRVGAGHGLDEVDVLMAGALDTVEDRPPWLVVCAALQDKCFDRVTRHFGRLLLHGALRRGAASVQWHPVESAEALWAVVCCPDPGCAGSVALPDGRWVPAQGGLRSCLHTLPVDPPCSGLVV